ncbi:hypothetical protein MT390_09185 [Vibrio sp. 2-Bac 85]
MIDVKKDIIDMNGCFFLKQTDRAQEQFSYLTGDKSITKDAINSFRKNIKHNVNYCSKKNIPYCHIVFPSKMVLFKKDFEKENIHVNSIYNSSHQLESVFYPIEILSKEEHFLNTDTHINEQGNFEIFKYLLEICNIKKKPIPYFEEVSYKGDLGEILNLSPEKTFFLKSYNKIIPHVKHYTLSNALKGNTGDLDYFLNSSSISNKRLLLFGDSFFKNSINIYTSFFQEVIYIRNPFIIDCIANILQPDTIFTGNAERYLVTPPSVDCYRPYFSNFISCDFDTSKISKESSTALQLLLLGRSNHKFKDWLFNKRTTIPKIKMTETNVNQINELDVITDRDVDFCRDVAVKYENINLPLALHLMRIAFKKRPDGEFIIKKLNEYERKVR